MMSDNVLEIRELSKDYGDFVLDKVSFSLPRGVIFWMKLKSKINSVWSLMKTISLIFLRQRKSENSCLEFIPAGIGLFIASISKNLNCRKIRKSKIFPKA